MNIVQVKRLAAWYEKYLGSGDGTEPGDYVVNFVKRLQNLPDEKVEKAMRWLGFIQGALWARHWFSIDQLKQHSRQAAHDEEITV